MEEDDSTFPIDTESRFVNWLQNIILVCIKILAVFMTLVVIWGVIDIGELLYEKMGHPPYLILNIEDIFSVFGAFLAVLISIEIFINIILYLKKEVIHLKLVIATALMAIARKVIVLDYDHTSYFHLFGIGAIIAALGLAYWFVRIVPKKLSK